MTTPDPQSIGDSSSSAPLPTPTPETSKRDAERASLIAERNELRTKVKEVEHTRASATFVSLVIGAIILILLLVFILQNLTSQTIKLFVWEVSLPLGVSLLIAAIAGALIVALAGGVRIWQQGRALKKAKKIGPK